MTISVIFYRYSIVFKSRHKYNNPNCKNDHNNRISCNNSELLRPSSTSFSSRSRRCSSSLGPTKGAMAGNDQVGVSGVGSVWLGSGLGEEENAPMNSPEIEEFDRWRF